MLKEADHLERVKRLRVSDTDLSPLKSAYEVSICLRRDYCLFHCYSTAAPLQTALNQLKELYVRAG